MISRRSFGKVCTGGVVLLGTRHPLVAAAALLIPPDGGALPITGVDDESRAFAGCLRRTSSIESEVVPFDGSAAAIVALRAGLARRCESGSPRCHVTGLVGTHAYPVLETLLRDAGGALIVRGLHVVRSSHERHLFLSTPASAGVGAAFRGAIGAGTAPAAVEEHVIGESGRGVLRGWSPPRRCTNRLDVLALVYSRFLIPEHEPSATPGPPAPGTASRLNHESFVFRL